MGKILSNKEVFGIRKMIELGEIDEQEGSELIIDGTPSLWCETYLNSPEDPKSPLILRSYQTEVLNKDAKTIAIRWGRQIGKTVALTCRMLWEACTEPNCRIVYFAPRKKHLMDVFSYVESMAKQSKHVSSLIARAGKDILLSTKGSDAIESIVFRNGSSIKFFHTGSKVALEQIRGSSGDKWFLDEAAFIDAEALGAISGLLVSSKDALVWAQSTPLNAEGWFYEFCQSADYESHHTSRESPDWTEEKERIARLLCGDDATFRREYLAEFTSTNNTLFDAEDVDRCMSAAETDTGSTIYKSRRYLSTEEVRSIPGSVFIGVDWNSSSAGTKILLVKSPSFDRSSIIYQEVYSIEEPIYNQRTAVDKLFELIDQYKPPAVAIDKGYATGALEYIETRLSRSNGKYDGIIHIVDSGEAIRIPMAEFFFTDTSPRVSSSWIIKDRDGKEEYIRMRFKNLMVAILGNLISTRKVMLPPLDQDLEKRTLAQELKSVRIARYGPDGWPVYNDSNCHKFSALLLACYAHFIVSNRYVIEREHGKKVLRKRLPEGDSTYQHKSPLFTSFTELERTSNRRELYEAVIAGRRKPKSELEYKDEVGTMARFVTSHSIRRIGNTRMGFNPRSSGFTGSRRI